MSTDNTTSLIVVLRNTSDVEKDGRIIRFGNGANLDTIRSLAAEKLAITGGYANIQLFNSNGELLGGIDDLRQQQVVYIDTKELIRETVPGPTKLPFVGSLYEMLPNLDEGWMRQFDRFGPLVEISLFGKIIVDYKSRFR
ncbi:hypothetical protein G6F61_012665 [Rhizopus arrhizus]|nr:hypothetical protein G6F61_012665 [Rhizopus arrhizus]